MKVNSSFNLDRAGVGAKGSQKRSLHSKPAMGNQQGPVKEKDVKPPRENLSRQDILMRLEEHREGKGLGRSLNKKKFEQAKNLEMDLDRHSGMEVKEHVGDVGLNRPDDPNTQMKLKEALSNGAFSFNPKERDVLQKILGNDA